MSTFAFKIDRKLGIRIQQWPTAIPEVEADKIKLQRYFCFLCPFLINVQNSADGFHAYCNILVEEWAPKHLVILITV